MTARLLAGGDVKPLEIPADGTRGGRGFGGPVARLGGRIMAALYRRSGGRSASFALILTTIGARSGEPRTVSIRRFDDGDGRWLVVGSNGGAAKHPAWFRNLARNPDQVWVDVGRDHLKVRPELLQGEERAAAWKRVVREASNFGPYEHKTDRQIPVVRLTREG
jgi:deazaflavin-dependent oxidoreductase (nitroreductase family)